MSAGHAEFMVQWPVSLRALFPQLCPSSQGRHREGGSRPCRPGCPQPPAPPWAAIFRGSEGHVTTEVGRAGDLGDCHLACCS